MAGVREVQWQIKQLSQKVGLDATIS
jgi:hypothetical protein